MPPVGIELAPGVKQIKPADDIDLGSPGLLEYSSTVQLPSGWSVFPAQSTDVSEDWAEYHATYAFKDGAFTADRRLLVKKNKVPLDQWDRYLAFRRAIYDDEIRMEPVMVPGAQGGFSDGAFVSSFATQRQEILDAVRPLQDAAAILEAQPPANPDALAKAVSQSDKALDAIEAKSTTLPIDDTHSLYWSQALAFAWCVKGWSALESKDLPTAESYLRAAWRLQPDRICGLLLGRLLEAKNDKPAAAHQYELAHISVNPGAFGISLSESYDADKKIAEGYRRVTGKELTAVTLNQHGAYSGSLEEERDRISEIHGFIRVTKLTGSALYAVAFEAGKPVKASFLGGDKGLESLVPALRSHTYLLELPAGSKARLLREVRMICTPWAGCDAYFLLPNAIKMPSHETTIQRNESNTKTVHVVQLPVEP
jgi:hypothetical protein